MFGKLQAGPIAEYSREDVKDQCKSLQGQDVQRGLSESSPHQGNAPLYGLEVLRAKNATQMAAGGGRNFLRIGLTARRDRTHLTFPQQANWVGLAVQAPCRCLRRGPDCPPGTLWGPTLGRCLHPKAREGILWEDTFFILFLYFFHTLPKYKKKYKKNIKKV